MLRIVPLLLLLLAFHAGAQSAEPDAAELPPGLKNVPEPAPAPARDAQAVDKAIQRGIAFLLEVQNKDGSWGSAHNTKDLNIYAPVPGAHDAFRSGVTALCVSALIETGDEREAVKQAIERGEKWLLEELPTLRRANAVALYNVWGHAYGIQALVRMHGRAEGNEARRREIERLIGQQIELLERYESVDGGWGYYDFDVGAKKPASLSTSFTTATVLVALAEARPLGQEMSQKIIERAIESIQRQRKSDYSYLYGLYLRYAPMHVVNRPAGSLGRTQACNIALHVWGDEAVTVAVMHSCLDRFFARKLWLDIGRKRPIPHESWFAVAGYFFYYGYYYAALCIEQLPAAEQSELLDHLVHVLLERQESDGSWWDFPLYNYHQQYGTAFALMALVRCR